ncbi:hypothetical protein ACJJTC_004551 [Scirpophaga incertulas]
MDARCARSVTPLFAASCTAWSAPWTRAAPARHGRALRQVSDPAACCFLHRVERAMDARCARSVTPLFAASCTAWSAPWTRAAPGQCRATTPPPRPRACGPARARRPAASCTAWSAPWTRAAPGQ